MDPDQAFKSMTELSEELGLYDEPPPYLTSGGRELTTTWIEAAANEAEEGYDISRFHPRNVVAPVHHVHDTDEVNSGES
jgi:hypothetical protein